MAKRGKGFSPQIQTTIRKVEIRDSAPDGTETDEDKIAKEINSTKQSVTRETSDQPEPVSQVKEEKRQEIDISTLGQIIAQQNQELVKSLQAEQQRQLEEVTQKHQERVDQLSAQVQSLEVEKKEAKKAEKIIADLLKMTGNPNPQNITEKQINFNTQISPNDAPKGAWKECLSLVEGSPTGLLTKFSPKSQIAVDDFDQRELSQYMRKNHKQICSDLTDWGKRSRGWFQNSSVARGITQAPTTIADLPGGFLQILSALIRETHRSGLVWWQFTTINYSPDARIQQDIVIPRIEYLTSSDDYTDYQLSGGGTYADLVSTSDPINSKTTQVTVQEWGRGKDGATTAISPVMIPAFVSYYSAYNLIQELQRLLGRDYCVWEDKAIKAQYDTATTVLYNNNGEVAATTPSPATAKMTRQFLRALFEYLHINLVMPFSDGCYCLVMPGKSALRQLKDELDDKWEANTKANLEELTEILIQKEYPNYGDGKITGYHGVLEGFHLFSSNQFGIGATGTENVTDEGGGTFRQSYAFGDGAVGQGISMPFTVRPFELQNFGRYDRWTWLTWQGIDTVDVDPNNDASEQLRVFKVRTAD